MKYDRIWNFSAGPAALPLEVLERVHEQWFNYHGSGMNVMEMSHRSKEYDEIHVTAVENFKKILGVGDDFHVLFLQGGASTQFAMLPMNFLAEDQTADYINTGAWSKKAIKEAKMFGKVNVAFDGETVEFKSLPKLEDLKLTAGARYVHITSNNTIKGTQFFDFPNVGDVPLIGDMSSDIFCRPFDAKPFGMIYAGAQKNLGPSGVTVVALRDDFYKTAKESGIPSMLAYSTHVDKNSLYNTPPCFSIYMLGETLKWVLENGGTEGMAARNKEKADTLYSFLDENNEFFTSPIAREARSWMNVVFRLPNEDLEKALISEGKAAGFSNLKGHRSVGGIRISMYNATPIDAINDVIDFMKDFMAKHA